MSRRRGRRSKFQEDIARNRIEKIFSILDRNSNKVPINPERCINFVRLISKRYNQRLSSSERLKFCRNCNSKYNLTNSRFRISNKGRRVVTCLKCNSVYRYPIV